MLLALVLALVLGGAAAFAVFGDALLTLLLRRFARQYVGENVLIFWSLRDGVLEINNLALAKSVLPALEPLVGVPFDLEKLELQQFAVELPLVGRFLLPPAWRKSAGMQSRVHIAGLQIGLMLNEAEKWIWTREENLERLQQAVTDAATARLARADSWTATAVQKLKALADAREAIRAAKKAKASSKTPAAVAAASTVASSPAFWHVLLDEIIDSVAIVVRRFSVTICDEHSTAGLGVAFEKFEIGRSHDSGARCKRVVQLNEFEVFVNPQSRGHAAACSVVRPFSMEISVHLPYVFQGLLMQVGGNSTKRTLELDVAFAKDQPFGLQLRPAQIRFLMAMLTPLSFHADWCNRAAVQDEIACVELDDAAASEYMTLFKAQWVLEHETGLLQRMFANYRHKDAIAARKARLAELEANALASRLLDLRARALAWKIPRGGVPLPHTPADVLRRGNLRKFLQSPLEQYEPDLPAAAPMFHAVTLSFTMHTMRLELLEDADRSLLAFVVHDLELELSQALEKVAADANATVVGLSIRRFQLLDERRVTRNVFPQLLDRNPDAEAMLTLHVVTKGSEHTDVGLELSKFSVLVVFDPLIAAMHTFLPALGPDEPTQMRFLAYETLSGPQSPEQREQAAPLYRDDLPQEYSPLLFGGLPLTCKVLVEGIEICLLGDSASVKSHVLAFTSDAKLQIMSSARHEGIELELAEVALQPCTIVLREEGIELELGGRRTILELEGEGVDLELGYKLTVGDSNLSSSRSATSSSRGSSKSGSKLWGLARQTALKKNIAEVAHPELSKADEIAVHSSKRERVRAGAKRKVIMKMSDFALNLSPNDLGVFLSILSSLNDSMLEDQSVVKQREELEARITKKKKEFEEKRHLEHLKSEFKLRDVDGGGSLDVAEIESLLRSLPNCQNLTKDEFDNTVREFIAIVDSDGSGDISLEEFESALRRNKIIYPRLHTGVVSLTGQEYVDPSMQRSQVPYLKGEHAASLSNAAALSAFWTRYVEQVGVSKTSLNGLAPMVVQMKMVRAFKNYDYAQEAWYRLVNPSLVKVGEQSVWLLSKEMDMGSRGNVIDQLLSSLESADANATRAQSAAASPELRMFVHTICSTAFGGFYFRLMDDMLPLGLPALEVSLEELAIYGNFSMWEGEAASSSTDVRAHRRAKNNYGVGKLSFDVYGKYYNSKARQIEPFLEFYQGVLDVKKDPESHTDIVYTSDRYLQLNITSAFMEAVNANATSFSKAERLAERERAHIKEEDGIFWLLNESGVGVKYYVVAKKEMKEKLRVETVTAVVTVPAGESHPCVLLNVDEELKDYEEQSLKEKQLRQAFRNADSDGSGELDTEEVRTVLRQIFEEEEKQRHSRTSASSFRRSDSSVSEQDLDKVVEDFIALADTDMSGLVSWEEFKAAISKMRATVDKFISVEVEGFKTVHNVSIVASRETQVYELVPFFPDVEAEHSIAALYTQGVELLNKIGKPSRRELQKAFACLHRVKELDPSYEWIDSYYAECMRTYLPVLLAVHISGDGTYGLQVKVSSAEYIRNDTAKISELMLVDENGDVSRHNPEQRNGSERYRVLPPYTSMSIPIDLVDAGSFAIRQVGETEWSNFLPLSVHDQRLYKHLTRYEQREARNAQLQSGSASISATKLVAEKLGKDVLLPSLNEYAAAGTETVYPSLSCIDNQPTSVVEKTSLNNVHLGTWSLVIQPQLVLHNVLPCGIEYVIVQAGDCPSDTLDSKGKLRVSGDSPSSSRSKAVKMLGQVDYFSFVDEVNSRRMFVESGQSVQIFGLDLDAPAIMKLRLCASSANRADQWSPVFHVGLNADRTAFNKEIFELRFDDGPGVVYQQEWQANAARTITLYAPYWIQNRSGLDLRFKLPKGTICSTEQHRAYFHGDREIPMLANAPLAKAMLSVKPYQATPPNYESDTLSSPQMKKFLPKFEKVDWSEPTDLASVGTSGDLTPSGNGDFSFVLAFEVRAAAAQFFRSKILVVSPRYVVINRVPRPLQVAPVLLDKKLRGPKMKAGAEAQPHCTLKADERAAVYAFVGKEKHWTGLRVRDYARDGGAREAGAWSKEVPVKETDDVVKTNDDFNWWTRGSLGDGPIVNISVHAAEATICVTLKDVSTAPPYRIENRSSRHAFRYVQHDAKGAEELVVQPLESHSFVWDDPLADKLQVKVTPAQWKVPTIVDFMRIGEIENITPGHLHGEVYIDGVTRVLAIGDTTVYAAVRQQAFLNDWLSDLLIDMAFHGVGITVVDDHPQEVLNLTMENMRLESSAGSRTCVFTLHHLQIDDMSPGSPYPVVLAPLDSGFNSDKREDWLPTHDERPFFSVAVETAPQSGITIVNDFDVEVHSLSVKLSLEYLLKLQRVFAKFVPETDEETARRQGIEYKNGLLTLELPLPDEADQAGLLLYFKRWRMSPYDFHLVFDSVQEDNGDGISSIVGPTLGSILGGIAHVTPEFHFGEIEYRNKFFYQNDLVFEVVWEIVFAVVRQWYKIVGSVELLGDPVGLATEIADGFALAARQLKRDVRGQSLRKGQSAVTLAQTVLGAPFHSLGKVSNGLGDVVKKATSFKSQELSEEPRHVPEGLYQSGVVLSKSLAYGVSGFVKEPVRGARSGGFKGFAKGVGRGTMQLIASPVVGTLGVVEKMAQSVSNTTHLMDEKTFDGGRRPARDLVTNHLKPLSDSNVITEVEVHCLYIDGLPDNVNAQVVVRVMEPAADGPPKTKTYKSTTIRRSGTPKFDQSWLIGISSLETMIDINVYHKRKPLPKKLLGYLRFSIEDIYREFEPVPAKLLADSKAKMRLKRRKRVRGSIISELASASAAPVEVRDESWKQRVRQTSSSIFSDSAEGSLGGGGGDGDSDSDSYEDDVEMLSSRSFTVSDSFPPTPMEFELLGCDSPAKMFLSIRYVNDMRRLPYVHTASEIQEMKFWRLPTRESHKIADPVRRAKNQTARLINAQLSRLSGVTRKASLSFPALKHMHPFEREVVVLTLGHGAYEANVQKLRKVYAALHNTGKQHERESQDVRTKQEAEDCGLRCIEALREVVEQNGATLRQVADMTKMLRGLPYVDVERPIFAFVGAPNVGKSSLVRALSTASPEVANYPFTTRGITMGHIYVRGTTYQIADTPGLIYRPDVKRNAIEHLALAMIEKTQASIGFVFDPTGASGTSLPDQLLLRDELHGRVFKAREGVEWLDIISKIDQPFPDLAALQRRLGPASLAVSAQTNQGLVELGEEIRRVLVPAEEPESEE
ncbi:hypothetical protein PybrP1_011044 [[Pythium] brassicae (nom. inval.)]|nr:hypothetical protein PybrP1_011044 [[Pythium] brassicae (nom. inval.)]